MRTLCFTQSNIIPDGENNKLVNITENDLTEHCKYFINNLKK